MTRVCYYRNEYRLRAEGHAGAGEKGRDLICAAESILMMALERHVSQRPEMRAEDREKAGGGGDTLPTGSRLRGGVQRELRHGIRGLCAAGGGVPGARERAGDMRRRTGGR